jgi:DNA-directed RNA polymerase subunit L
MIEKNNQIWFLSYEREHPNTGTVQVRKRTTRKLDMRR